MKRLTFMAAVLAMGLGPGPMPLPPLLPRSREPREPRREFTDEELAYVRSLPRKERKRAVAALKAKHRLKAGSRGQAGAD